MHETDVNRLVRAMFIYSYDATPHNPAVQSKHPSTLRNNQNIRNQGKDTREHRRSQSVASAIGGEDDAAAKSGIIFHCSKALQLLGQLPVPWSLRITVHKFSTKKGFPWEEEKGSRMVAFR